MNSLLRAAFVLTITVAAIVAACLPASTPAPDAAADPPSVERAGRLP